MARLNEFLQHKIEERNLSAKGFADSMGISENLAAKYLSPSGRFLPSDRVAKKISMVLKFTREEEAEFLRILEQERDREVPLDQIIDEGSSSSKDLASATGKLWIAIVVVGFFAIFSFACSAFLLFERFLKGK